MPLTPAAASPIGRTSSSLKRIAMPRAVASRTSFFPSVSATQPRLSPSLTFTRRKVCAEGPGSSLTRTLFDHPAARDRQDSSFFGKFGFPGRQGKSRHRHLVRLERRLFVERVAICQLFGFRQGMHGHRRGQPVLADQVERIGGIGFNQQLWAPRSRKDAAACRRGCGQASHRRSCRSRPPVP